MGKEWVKLYTKQWLFGSTRNELTPAERSVWIDLLALAGLFNKEGKSEGIIPVPQQTLSRMLNVHPTITKRAMQKFLDYKKITIDDDGSIHIINWARYNPSRLEIHRNKLKQGETKGNITEQDETLERDRERDIDKDIERDKDKEIKSLIILCHEELINTEITTGIEGEIRRVAKLCSVETVEKAVKVAVLEQNNHTWSYVIGILKKWGFEV